MTHSDMICEQGRRYVAACRDLATADCRHATDPTPDIGAALARAESVARNAHKLLLLLCNELEDLGFPRAAAGLFRGIHADAMAAQREAYRDALRGAETVRREALGIAVAA